MLENIVDTIRFYIKCCAVNRGDFSNTMEGVPGGRGGGGAPGGRGGGRGAPGGRGGGRGAPGGRGEGEHLGAGLGEGNTWGRGGGGMPACVAPLDCHA